MKQLIVSTLFCLITITVFGQNTKPIRTYTQTTEITAVRFLKRGYVATTSANKTVIIWDEMGQVKFKKKEEQYEAFFPLTDILRVEKMPSGTVNVYPKGESFLGFRGVYGAMIIENYLKSKYAVAVSPDYKSILVGRQDGVVVLFDTKFGPVREFKGHVGAVTAVAFSADGTQILTGGMDKKALLWNIKN